MVKQKVKLNKKTLIDVAQTSLDEEFGPLELSSNVSQENEVYYENENHYGKDDYKTGDAQDIEIRDRGDWEAGLSEVIPTKIRRKNANVLNSLPKEKIKIRVDVFEKLPNGLTAHEMMYGKQDNDSDYLNKELE